MDGYWLEKSISGIPARSGVYCVYACRYNPPPDDTVTITKLIYIGESANVNERIANHEKWPIWKKHLGSGEVICISFGYVAPEDRQRVEAAMIYEHKPPVNDEYKHNFPFDTTTISLSGKTKLLKTNFTVYRTQAIGNFQHNAMFRFKS